MSQYSSVNTKPTLVNTLGIMTLVSGIINIGYGLVIAGSIVLGTLGLGLLCAPFFILPSVLGIFEVIYATRLMSNPPQPVKANQTLAILEICGLLTGNVVSAIAGVVALIFYNDREVIQYFAQFNGEIAQQ